MRTTFTLASARPKKEHGRAKENERERKRKPRARKKKWRIPAFPYLCRIPLVLVVLHWSPVLENLAVVFWLSCTGFPFLADVFQLSCPGFPFQIVEL
jgi:hypothetical protein